MTSTSKYQQRVSLSVISPLFSLIEMQHMAKLSTGIVFSYFYVASLCAVIIFATERSLPKTLGNVYVSTHLTHYYINNNNLPRFYFIRLFDSVTA